MGCDAAPVGWSGLDCRAPSIECPSSVNVGAVSGDVRLEAARRRSMVPVIVGWVGIVSVAVGYLLEVNRHASTVCVDGHKSPDTLGISVVLILFVGGLAGIVGIASAVALAIRQRWMLATTVRTGAPALISLAGALSILVFAGRASEWFNDLYCSS